MKNSLFDNSIEICNTFKRKLGNNTFVASMQRQILGDESMESLQKRRMEDETFKMYYTVKIYFESFPETYMTAYNEGNLLAIQQINNFHFDRNCVMKFSLDKDMTVEKIGINSFSKFIFSVFESSPDAIATIHKIKTKLEFDEDYTRLTWSYSNRGTITNYEPLVSFFEHTRFMEHGINQSILTKASTLEKEFFLHLVVRGTVSCVIDNKTNRILQYHSSQFKYDVNVERLEV